MNSYPCPYMGVRDQLHVRATLPVERPHVSFGQENGWAPEPVLQKQIQWS
jgi:hypothetical protein